MGREGDGGAVWEEHRMDTWRIRTFLVDRDFSDGSWRGIPVGRIDCSMQLGWKDVLDLGFGFGCVDIVCLAALVCV